jgi:multiple sugar transport system permease protein
MRQNERLTPSKVGANALLVLLAAFFFFPFYWIVTGAFKIQNVAIQVPPEWFPLHPTMQNFADLSKSPVLRWTFNSFAIALGTTFLVCVAASMGGYALAKKRFPGRDIIFGLFIAAMSLPKQVIMIPLFTMLANWKWINTYQALILPAAAWPFGIFLMRQFSQTLPSELLEAAKIDGCGEARMFVKIALPIIKPGIGALAIFTFIGAWNDYFSQLILTRSTEMQTLPLGISALQAEFTTNYGMLMAGAAIASVPMIIIFIAFQKYFTQGITMGAVKG